MELINPEIHKYLLDLLPPRDPVLAEMEEVAARESFPIVGPLVGNLIYQLAMMINARRIIELGSGYGYSALWFARALRGSGTIICTDENPENAKRAAEFFDRAGVSASIDYRVGDAVAILDSLDGEFDIIFNDAHKYDYPKIFYKSLPKLRRGGLLIADNALHHGKVLDVHPDESTAALLTWNRLIYSTPDLVTTIIPVRDGVSVSLKR